MNQRKAYLVSCKKLERESEKCSHCGNVYRVELVKESDDYNDFDMRWCPFCGLLQEE